MFLSHSDFEKNATNQADAFSTPDYLEPGHHGQGIMSLTLKTLIDEWMVPRMDCHRISGVTFVSNHASAKIFLNSGFMLTQTSSLRCYDVPKGRGGGKMTLQFLRRTPSASENMLDLTRRDDPSYSDQVPPKGASCSGEDTRLSGPRSSPDSTSNNT
jgi:hypothetical protein